MAQGSVTCPRCGVEEAFADGGPPEPLHTLRKFRCENGECQAKYVFGKEVPRIAIEPWLDNANVRWVRIRIQDRLTKQDLYVFDLDPEDALVHAKAVLSLL